MTLDTMVCQLLPQLQKLGFRFASSFDDQLVHSRSPIHKELKWILLYASDNSHVCDDVNHLRTTIALMVYSGG